MVNYDKNVLPLQYEFSQYDAENNGPFNIIDLYSCLDWRNLGIRRLKELPSLILRNLKPTIRKPESSEYAFKEVVEDIGRLRDALKTLPKDEKKRANLIKKIAASKNNLKQMVEIAQHFAHAFTGNEEEFSKDQLLSIIEDIEAEVLQNTNNLLVVKVNSFEAMQSLACTSTWCFARPSGESYWDDYAQLGYIDLIFDFSKDFDDALFLITYIPGSTEIYASTNVPLEDLGIDDPHGYLQQIGVDMAKLEGRPAKARRPAPEPKPVAKPVKPVKQGDPNQLSMAFESRSFVKAKLRENIFT